VKTGGEKLIGAIAIKKSAIRGKIGAEAGR
jgi:hypothetical protein